jgi:hypothetical protein
MRYPQLLGGVSSVPERRGVFSGEMHSRPILVFSPHTAASARQLFTPNNAMEKPTIQIQVYDKREKMTGNLYVVDLGDNRYRMTENDIFNCRLTLGVEFETRVNDSGVYEIIRIVKHSPYVTRRFLLSTKFTESDYRAVGDEIVKKGGFWQVDFGGVATINLPPGCNLDLDKLFKLFDFYPMEIVGDKK